MAIEPVPKVPIILANGGWITPEWERYFELVSANIGTGGGGGAVDSVFGRTGVVVAVSGDYDHSEIGNQTANDHHNEAHTIASHSDTTATGAELETLTDGSDADSLHDHAIADAHIASSANPHSVTASQVGLGNVNDSSITNGFWETVSGNAQLKTADDINFANLKAIAMVCDNGSTLPTSGIVTGQWFLHTPTGRKILYQYDTTDAEWKPIISFGSITVYVDNTDGTDSMDGGTGVDSDAFATIQFAVDIIPGLVGGDVAININAESYAEALAIKGKSFTGPFDITINGTFSEQVSESTVSSATAGSRTANATLTLNGASWTTDAYQGMFLKFEDDTTTSALQGQIYTIKTNDNATNSVLEIIGGWVDGFGTTPSGTDTFTIQKPGTTISEAFLIDSGQQGINFNKIDFSGAGSAAWTDSGATVSLQFCKISGTFGMRADNSALNNDRCYFNGGTGRLQFLISASSVTQLCLFKGGTHGYDNVFSSWGNNSRPNVFTSHTTVGQFARNNASAGNSTAGNRTKTQIENCTTGIQAEKGGIVGASQASQVIYTGNTTDTNAVAASFGFIEV